MHAVIILLILGELRFEYNPRSRSAGGGGGGGGVHGTQC
jgi:hypothetical protein